jgi:hypothetical protein
MGERHCDCTCGAVAIPSKNRKRRDVLFIHDDELIHIREADPRVVASEVRLAAALAEVSLREASAPNIDVEVA